MMLSMEADESRHAVGIDATVDHPIGRQLGIRLSSERAAQER